MRLIHPFAVPLGILLLSANTFFGCFGSLPPPMLRQVKINPGDSYEKLCPLDLKRVDFTIHDDAPLAGILECESDHATIVLFNTLKLRVRTILISRGGDLRDEISYLSSHDGAAEQLFKELSTEINGPSLRTSGELPHLTVQSREQRKVTPASQRGVQSHPTPAKTDRN